MARLVFVLFFLCGFCSLTAALTPLTIQEVSLMLRSGYSSDDVLKELSTRKLADTFDSTGEKRLIQAGASAALIGALRNGVYQLSAAEIAVAKKRQEAVEHARAAARPIPDVPLGSHVDPSATNASFEGQVGGNMYDHLKDNLVYWHEGSLVPFDNETLQKKKFYLLFFSAIWSKEGGQFTAKLVDYYNSIHPQHPEIEIIFFSADRSELAMENYISQTKMPWPAVAYDKLPGKAGAIAESLRTQIPRLTLADASGKILSDSGEGQPDLERTLIDLDKLLTGPATR
jgi:Thioredoxin-like